MDLEFLSQADQVTLKLEVAKRALETAKTELENAKRAYDELFAQAEHHGFAKAKLKKVTEERIQSLIDSGMIAADVSVTEERRERPVKKSKKAKPAGEESFVPSMEGVDFVESADIEAPEDSV